MTAGAAASEAALASLEGAADIWLVDPAALSPAEQARCLELLDHGERARHDRFLVERDRLLYRVAHAMVRDVLARYLGPAPLRFEAGPWGRPELAGAGQSPPLRFNLSHTHGLAALVLTRSADCGIDVEAVDRLKDPLALAQSVFAPAEVAALRALPRDLRRERFFAYWTLKEAYIKARGMGLALPLDGFAFTLDAPAGDTVTFASGFDDPGGGWWFQRWSVTPRHRAAVGLRALVAPAVRRARWPGP